MANLHFGHVGRVTTSAIFGLVSLGVTGNILGGLFGILAGQVCCNAINALPKSFKKTPHLSKALQDSSHPHV